MPAYFSAHGLVRGKILRPLQGLPLPVPYPPSNASMSLAKLDVSNVRNIEAASLSPSPRLNFILGPNGSGKTSLL